MTDIDTTGLDAALADDAFSGVVAVDVGGERLIERTAGWAHRAHRVPLRADTRLAMASGSKIFTALAVLRLVEDGRLSLDRRVRDLLGGDLPLVDDAVTIEQLLAHRSGIGDYIDEDAAGDIDDYVLDVPVHRLTSAEAYLPALNGRAQKFAPGSAFSYCNSGYAVLAIVVERVTGELFTDAVRRLVVEPAGMERTDALRLDALPADAALGYLDESGDRVNTLHLPVVAGGDGGFFTTTADLHRFWRALRAGRIVSPTTRDEMVRRRGEGEDEDVRYGLGLWLREEPEVLSIEGYDAGVSFWSAHVPADDATWTVISNTSEGAWPVARALRAALEARAGA